MAGPFHGVTSTGACRRLDRTDAQRQRRREHLRRVQREHVSLTGVLNGARLLRWVVRVGIG